MWRYIFSWKLSEGNMNTDPLMPEGCRPWCYLAFLAAPTPPTSSLYNSAEVPSISVESYPVYGVSVPQPLSAISMVPLDESPLQTPDTRNKDMLCDVIFVPPMIQANEIQQRWGSRKTWHHTIWVIWIHIGGHKQKWPLNYLPTWNPAF